MTHRIDWTRYGEQTITPDRIVTAVCGETITGGDAREYPTCPDCIQEVMTTNTRGSTAAQTWQSYVGRIRNADKRTYAHVYALYMLHGGQVEPEHDRVSYMAAQAVRLELFRLIPQRP